MTNRKQRYEPRSRAAGRLALLLAAAIAVVPMAALAAADDVASLYGPQPPADATYVRVVNLSTRAAKVALPSGAPALDLAPGAATTLDVVRPGTPLLLKVDGQTPARQGGGASVAGTDTAGSTITVAIDRGDAGAWRAVSVAAPMENADALRAQLRLVNFAQGCDGKVTLERNGASVVFQHVAPGHAATRSINPVAATLVAVCGEAVSAPFALPRLAAGQRYSLFLSGSPTQPALRGAPDTLGWPAQAWN